MTADVDKIRSGSGLLSAEALEEHKILMGKHQTNIINRKFDYAYMAIPKCANSAVKYALLPTVHRTSQDIVDKRKIINSIHDKSGRIFEYTHRSAIAMNKPTLRLAVVRNTWERIASCYFDKIQCNFHKPFEVYGFSENMKFADFVQEISGIDDRHSEIHFRSQYSMLAFRNNFIPNITIEMHTLDILWPIVREYFRNRFNITVDPIKVINKKGIGNYGSFYSQETIDAVYQRFRKEIDFFRFKIPNYDEEIESV